MLGCTEPVDHPPGYSELPDYELRRDSKLYRTAFHPGGFSIEPEYEIRHAAKLCRLPRQTEMTADLQPALKVR